MAFNEQIWWHITRSAGIVSLLCLTLSVLWGLALSTKIMGKKAPASWLLDLHRYLSMMSVLFVATHMIALVPDNYVYFGWLELFVPGQSEWKTGAVAWGIVAFYLLIAIEISSLLMRRIPRRFWRLIHFTSFAMWAISIVHVITAGTDTTSRLFAWSSVVSVQLVLFFTIVRVMTARRLKRALKANGNTSSVDSVRAARLEALRNAKAEVADKTDGTSGDEVNASEPVGVDDQQAARLAALKQRTPG